MWMCVPVKATRRSLLSPAAAVYCNCPLETRTDDASAVAGRTTAAIAPASRARRALRGMAMDIWRELLGEGM
jgi:hypothetical protein